MNRDIRDSRTRLVIGQEGLDRLYESRVIVFGAGGVGGYVCEALVRAGLGHIEVVDSDVISESNINRQIIADYTTIGRKKTEVIEERLKRIAPDLDIRVHDLFYEPGPEMEEYFDFSRYDYVVDAIDFVRGKIDIIARSKEAGTPVISSMGTGNKLDPGQFRIADISKTSVCPLAKVVRKELRNRNIKDVKVLYSQEQPGKPGQEDGKTVPGSISFVPSVAGLLIAGQVIKDLIERVEE